MAILALLLRLLPFQRPAAQLNRRRCSRFRPGFDNLEGRLVPSTVRWINPAGGDWAVAANWSTGATPGANDDVVIDLPGSMAVRHTAGADTVHSITSRQSLMVMGGMLEVTSDATLSSLSLSGGTLGGPGRITVTGRSSWTGGTLAGDVSHPWLSVTGSLDISGPAAKLLDGRDLDIHGSATVSGGPLVLNNARLNNLADATLTLTGASLREGALWSAFVTNDGQVRVSNGAAVDVSYLTNSGTIQVYSGWLTSSHDNARVSNGGDILLWDIEGGLDVRADTFTQTGSTSGPGSVRVSANAADIDGEFNVNGNAAFSSGSFTFGVADFHVGRALSFTDAGFTFDAAVVEARTLTVDGSVWNWNTISATALSVSLSIDIETGNLTVFNSDVQTNTLTFAATGGIQDSTVTARTVINQGTLGLYGATTIATTEGMVNQGWLYGSGTIRGDLTNEGSLFVGGFTDVGQLTVTGNYIQTVDGMLQLKIGGSDPNNSCDQFLVGGRAVLGGTLSLALLDGYVPNVGDSFRGMSFGSQSGDFDQFVLPDLGDAMYLQAWSDGSGYSFTVQPRE